MTPTNRLKPLMLIAATLAVAALMGACSPEPAPPPPTRTPAPTFTPTVETLDTPADVNAAATAQAAVAQAAATQAALTVTGTQPITGSVQPPAPGTDQGAQPVPAGPTEAPTVAPTATPAAAEVVISQQINVRGGPGTNYNVIGGAQPGQRFPVTGKNQAGDWWQINYNGQAGWVFGQLVTTQNVEQVAIAQNIPPAPTAPPPPPATNTPVPQPTQPPAAQPTQPPAQPAPPADSNLPFILGDTARCDPNAATTYFEGQVRDTNNNLVNGVCILMFFYEPRTVKCSGCDGVGDGNWGFAPFGGPAPRGTTVEIYVVQCPSGGMPMGGLNGGFGDLTPQSPKWVRTINDSEQCRGITFYRK